MIEQSDFSVVVKNRARPPKPWRWEIYRAGRTSPIDHSEVYFEVHDRGQSRRQGRAQIDAERVSELSLARPGLNHRNSSK